MLPQSSTRRITTRPGLALLQLQPGPIHSLPLGALSKRCKRLTGGGPVSLEAAAHLQGQGFRAPAWEDTEAAPPDDDPYELLPGWQQRAAAACDERA